MACNFNSNANYDDGSCHDELWYLPIEVGSGPAISSCDAVEGYFITISYCVEWALEWADCDPEVWSNACQKYTQCMDIFGCTDPTVCNYNPDAETENGACEYSQWYIPNTDDSGNPAVLSCESISEYFLANQECTEYAITLDGFFCDNVEWDEFCLGDYYECLGISACNYDEIATFDDGSCITIELVASATGDMGGGSGVGVAIASGGSGGYEFSWVDESGAIANPQALSDGLHIVTVTDSAGCSTSIEVEVDDTYGLYEYDDLRVQVYPNPTTGILSLNLPDI